MWVDKLGVTAIVRLVMRPTRIIAIAGLSTALLGTANADIETSIGVGYTSDYVFRGTNNGADLLMPASMLVAAETASIGRPASGLLRSMEAMNSISTDRHPSH